MSRGTTTSRARTWLPPVVGAILVGTVAVVGAAVASRRTGLLLSSMTRDPDAVGDLSPYVGMVSMLGLAAWSAAAVTWALAAGASSRLGARAAARGYAAFAALSALMLVDDALQLHERVLPGLGLRERYVLALYGLCGVVAVGVALRGLPRRASVVGAAAVLLMAVSVGVDQVFPHTSWHGSARAADIETFVEDVLKLYGLVLWAAFAVVHVRLLLPARTSVERPLHESLPRAERTASAARG